MTSRLVLRCRLQESHSSSESFPILIGLACHARRTLPQDSRYPRWTNDVTLCNFNSFLPSLAARKLLSTIVALILRFSPNSIFRPIMSQWLKIDL